MTCFNSCSDDPTFFPYNMAEEDKDLLDVILACNAVHIAAAAALINVRYAQKTKRKHRVWINKYLLVRPQYGAYNNLMPDLLELDRAKFRNYIRIDPDDFEELFLKVETLIRCRDTKFRLKFTTNCYCC